ncbi:hypothetical protein FBULB1_13337 [Fusarium bulbicola]|nr:hypothetical protein FBULB1_13337 [Fusarium bulbicola]
MFQNDDTTCHQFAVDRFKAAKQGAPEIVLGDSILDPSKKLIKKLHQVKTAKDVANLRKPDGTLLVHHTSPEDLKAAADSISTLVGQAQKLSEKVQSQALSYSEDVSSLDTAPDTSDSQLFSLGDVADDITGLWHWVEEKFKDVVKWGCHFISYEDSKWGLTVTNFAANTVVKIVGKATKAEQPAIKRWKGSVAAVISVPMLCVALIQNINDSVEAKKKTTIIVNHFIEAFLKFGKQWGLAVSSWNNEVENEILYIALAVKQACTYGRYVFKIGDFFEEHV